MTDFATMLEEYLPSQTTDNKTIQFTVVTNPKKYNAALKTISEDGIIHCRTLDGNTCASNKCVGFCWSKLHKGYITKKIMEQHKCLERNCASFQKIEDASYWTIKEAKTQERKNKKQLKKLIAEEEAEFLEEIRSLTIHDFNFYPVAVELKNDIYETRIINFASIDYSHYLDLFAPAANGRKIHFTKIKADDERKRLIIETNNIIKVPAPATSEGFNIFKQIKKYFNILQEFIKNIFK